MQFVWIIAETEQRIADLKQQIEKARAHEVRWTSALRGPKRSEEIDERMRKLRECRAGGRTRILLSKVDSVTRIKVI